jgi:hypothetical protein
MAVRIRKDGSILCAALHDSKDGDLYLDDTIHYHLSCVAKVLVTQKMESHIRYGEWWWINSIPKGIEIDPFYIE